MTIEEIQTIIAPRGFKLLTTNYINNSQKLDVLCPNEHIFRPTWNNLRDGSGCSYCYGNTKGTAKKKTTPPKKIHRYTYEQVKQFYESKGYKLLSPTYKNNKTKLLIQCEKNHDPYETIFGVSKRGFGCPECSGNKKHSVSFVKQYVESCAYQLISDTYTSNREEIILKCPEGHNYSTTLNDFKNNGHRCGTCSKRTSNPEKEVYSFVLSYFPSSIKTTFGGVIENCDKQYKNKELDIYIPELRLAIEYCGAFWHSDLNNKPKNSHHDKYLWCKKHNIRLITIFSDEWLSRKEQVKNFILSVLGIHQFKIGARKCSVSQITNKEAIEFVNSYHIQKLKYTKVAFGLYFDSELIGVITGNKHHRQGHNSFILQRMCFKSGYQVSGGASKLLKELVIYAQNLGYKEIISWSDNRWSQGKVYEKMGFLLRNESGPDYSYVKNGHDDKRFSKQSLKKTKQEQISGKTEIELRREQGYYQMWDCGKKTWKLNI